MIFREKATSWEDDVPRYRISFAELQRMRLRKLQCQLVKDVMEMYSSNEEVKGWEERLQEYGRWNTFFLP
jgi:hypothetical protein